MSAGRLIAPPGETGASGGLALLALLLVVVAAAPPPLEAQRAGPGKADAAPERAAYPFEPPLASPLEPRTRLAPVHVDRGTRERWVGLVDLGDAFPFWLVRPDTAARGAPALAASLAGGAFTRFDLEGNGNEFVEAHFRVGLRLRAAMAGLEARAELYHVSSHLGDEYLVRTGREPISTSREGLELLLGGTILSSVRLYGGPGLLLRSTEDLDPGSLRAGAEWLPERPRWGPFRPYASAELFAWEEVGWEPLIAAEAGVAFGGGRYRTAFVVGSGPSRAEQFLREDETLYGLSFSAGF